ncbi:response regulator transcription factor [Neptunomonas phycophila]|jgi:two-component system response regulator PhoP|uniref:Response regulator transcription factor n=1 Tax=Neptunomonas phycophila TaxID=1572645 RepID=A0AAW7XJ46_9GAMM|nr:MULTISPECIES: response regulator transcription factor [Neptunomonas]MBT3144666.1 response regulator transcription factor [Neptunomonas phycophila]MDN2660811.1 response regulator transcription factor [Neptunomonas sp. CHC150]MDO6453751.1 response regulator transcription factor [Neptunomonas phycophila]MDO6467938.1 response regulator transcription factor [Neptunomonas phycophila]MDO6783983.1 response regulator transcription factor [Neptunomonas phycophila]
MKLLVVEDDADLRRQLVSGLESRGYTVEETADGQEALYLGSEFSYDLAIVDLGLPSLSGVELIRRWRAEERNFPILILTARSDWQDKVEGLEAGADDFLVKPFHMEELLARLNALLRRAAGHAKPLLEFGPLSLDTIGRVVACFDKPIKLTSYEYRTLEYLMLNAGKTVSKAELTEHLYHQDFDRDSNVLEVFIRRLRQKLDPDQTLNPITTVRGLGYRFDMQSS